MTARPWPLLFRSWGVGAASSKDQGSSQEIVYGAFGPSSKLGVTFRLGFALGLYLADIGQADSSSLSAKLTQMPLKWMARIYWEGHGGNADGQAFALQGHWHHSEPPPWLGVKPWAGQFVFSFGLHEVPGAVSVPILGRASSVPVSGRSV